MQRLLLRRKDAAEILAVSESQLLKWERAGLLHAINLNEDAAGKIRAVRYKAEDVQALAEQFMRAGQKHVTR